VKFEEDIEAGGDRWSKPHVGTLSVHSFYELEKALKQGGNMFDVDANSVDEINIEIINYIKTKVRNIYQTALVSRNLSSIL
jgi:hypothetical protein